MVDDGKVANRGFVIDRSGNIRARYDKIHLFDVDLPTGESWRESNTYSPGQGVVLVNGTPVGVMGVFHPNEQPTNGDDPGKTSGPKQLQLAFGKVATMLKETIGKR